MKILVPVKTVPDPAHPARLRADGAGVDREGVGEVINPFDEIALEAAIRLRESGAAQEAIALSIGPESWEEGLRTALALGVDRATRVAVETPPSPLGVARLIAAVARREGVTLIIAGKQSVDGDNGQSGVMAAGLLGWGQASRVSGLTVAEAGVLEAVREVDGGLERRRLPLPAVLTTELRLNTPRYASLPNIMKARRKSVEQATPEALGVEPEAGMEVVEINEPPRRPPGVRVPDVGTLLERLQNLGVLR